jgi:hypothetical protein
VLIAWTFCLKGAAVGLLGGVGGGVKLAIADKKMLDINKAAHSANALKGMAAVSTATLAVGVVSGAVQNDGGSSAPTDQVDADSSRGGAQFSEQPMSESLVTSDYGCDDQKVVR